MSDTAPPPATDALPRKSILHRPLSGGNCLGILLGIFGLIMALMIFAFYMHSRAPDRERASESRTMARTIANALGQFQADYHKPPLPSCPRLPGADCDTDTSPTHGFTDILAGKEGEATDRQNKRKADYFEGIKPAKKAIPKDTSTVWKNGIYLDETTSNYGVMDAWGSPFRIRIDTNKDAEIANPNPDQTASGRPVIPNKSAIVWSAGKDGDWTTWDDNLVSWD